VRLLALFFGNASKLVVKFDDSAGPVLRSLERKLNAQLYHPWRNRTHRCNLPDIAGGWIVIRLSEVWMIEGIKKLTAKLQIGVFKLPVFHEGHVSRIRTRSSNNVLTRIAKGSWLIHSKGCAIEIVVKPLRFTALMHFPGYARNDVGTVSALKSSELLFPSPPTTLKVYPDCRV